MLRFVVYSDYLCPWCYNASVRLHRLRRERPGQIELDWRSYLLRPAPRADRDLEKFRAYTRSWLRPGSEPDAPAFRVWEGSAGPPSHSVPPHLAAKAAARLGREAFEAMHDRLLRAYFAESRDITERTTLRELWAELGLPEEGFSACDDPGLRREVLAEYEEALELGVTGVPAVRVAGSDAFVIGAHPLDLYRRWARRLLDG